MTDSEHQLMLYSHNLFGADLLYSLLEALPLEPILYFHPLLYIAIGFFMFQLVLVYWYVKQFLSFENVRLKLYIKFNNGDIDHFCSLT